MSEKIELTREDLTKMLAEVSKAGIDERVKELGLDQLKNKFWMTGSSEEDLAKMSKAEKACKFIKAVYNKDMQTLVSMKAMTEGTGSAGGFIVPEEFAAEVNRIVEDFGLIAKMATKYPMGADTLNVPRLSASVSVSYPGEATAGSPSQPTLEQVVLSAKTVVGITPMSNELLADANVNVVQLLQTLFAEAIAGEEDAQGLAGTGSPYTGILGNADVNVVDLGTGPTSGATSFTDVTPDECRKLVTAIKPWALQGAGFVMHREVWGFLSTQKASVTGDYYASAANPVMVAQAGAGFPTAQVGTLWGYPVYLSDKMPDITNDDAVSTKFVVFGNLKHIYIGERAGLTLTISEHATVGADNLFEQNMSAVRLTKRLAIAVGLPKAFAVLKTNAS